jgi:hypothetical protein
LKKGGASFIPPLLEAITKKGKLVTSRLQEFANLLLCYGEKVQNLWFFILDIGCGDPKFNPSLLFVFSVSSHAFLHGEGFYPS